VKNNAIPMRLTTDKIVFAGLAGLAYSIAFFGGWLGGWFGPWDGNGLGFGLACIGGLIGIATLAGIFERLWERRRKAVAARPSSSRRS